MSDGPYKSLPMSKNWKNFVKLFQFDVYTCTDKKNALICALQADFQHGQFPNIKKIIEQHDLFSEIKKEELINLKNKKGVTSTDLLMIDVVLSKISSDSFSLNDSLKETLREHLHNMYSTIKEHLLRENADCCRLYEIEKFLENLNLLEITLSVFSEDKKKVLKHTGIEDGPLI